METLQSVKTFIIETIQADGINPKELVDVCKWAVLVAEKNLKANPEPEDESEPQEFTQ